MRRYVPLALALGLVAAAAPSQADLFYSLNKPGHYAQAVGPGQAYLDSHPKDDAFAIDLAYAYVNVGNRSAARSILLARDAFLRTHPDLAAIWLQLSYQDSDSKQYRDAIADVDRYLRYRPDETQAWKQRGYAVQALTPQAVAAPDASTLFYHETGANRFVQAIPLGESYLKAHPDNAAFAIDLAYAYLQVKNIPAAAAIAKKYSAFIATDENAAKLLPALFYAYQNEEVATALTYGRPYLTAHPNDDAFAMDLAYAELKAGDVAGVRAIIAARPDYVRTHPEAAKLWMEVAASDANAKSYQTAVSDIDAYLVFQPDDAAARSQRADYVNDYWGGAQDSFFATTYYDGRFADTFAYADQTYALRPGRDLQPYVALHLSEDARSGSPGEPQIFGDDALVADAGIRQSLGAHVTLFLEGGTGIGLRGQGTITDLRYGALFGQQWGAGWRGYTSVDASVGLYSRYGGNTISYYDLMHAFEGHDLRPIVGINGGYDSHDVFGNSFIEGLYGIEIGDGPVKFRIFGVEGDYLTRGHFDRYANYTTLRAMLVVGLQK